MSESDQELLRLAAKAAGKSPSEHDGVIYAGFGSREWNPLTDDGDSLRLVVALRMDLVIGGIPGRADVYGQRCSALEYLGGDPYAATRRAIVRVAAEIGRGMK
jgi:hypothetical protein